MSSLAGLLVVLFVLTAATACSTSDSGPGGVTSEPSTFATPDAPSADGEGLVYIALGDSLSVGVGASGPRTKGFVPLVQDSLGDGHTLLNFGHSGDTSSDLLNHGHLDDAITEIAERNGDDDAGNDVVLVTLEIGGNDLLRLYSSFVLTGRCPTAEVLVGSDECSGALASALEGFEPNLSEALDRLLEADPTIRLLLLTLYNPLPSFFGGSSDIAELSLEGLADTRFAEGLNDIIRAQAAERDVPVVDLYPRFEGKAGELIAADFVHPNNAGHQAMADAVIEVLAELP